MAGQWGILGGLERYELQGVGLQEKGQMSKKHVGNSFEVCVRYEVSYFASSEETFGNIWDVLEILQTSWTGNRLVN